MLLGFVYFSTSVTVSVSVSDTDIDVDIDDIEWLIDMDISVSVSADSALGSYTMSSNEITSDTGGDVGSSMPDDTCMGGGMDIPGTDMAISKPSIIGSLSHADNVDKSCSFLALVALDALVVVVVVVVVVIDPLPSATDEPLPSVVVVALSSPPPSLVKSP
jgi:hypothetical protein